MQPLHNKKISTKGFPLSTKFILSEYENSKRNGESRREVILKILRARVRVKER